MKNLHRVTPLLALTAALLISGCARFVTKQTDTSYDTNGLPQRAITTTAKATTFFDAKSALANFKAAQTDKSQTATVGTLSQESSSAIATNAAVTAGAFLGEMIRHAK